MNLAMSEPTLPDAENPAAQRRALATRSAAELAATLELFEKEMEEFAYIVAHDLNAPLRSVASFSQLLGERCGDALDEKSLTYLQFITDGAQRTQHMIEGLLTYSRLNTRAFPARRVNAALLVSYALEPMQDSIAQMGARIHCGPLPEIEADPAQIISLFAHLLGNALKFRHVNTAPEITLTASAVDRGAEWLFCVADNGIGLESFYSEKIFKIFRRLHKEEEYPGLGMGLALAKKIVERHRGRIWVESTPGQGARFYFTLPVAMED